VVPGGPGGSGVKRLTSMGAALRDRLGGAYDLVAFDPRGVGGSTRARCGIPAEDRHLVTLRSWPAPDGSVAENVARARRTAEACARDGGAVVRGLSTANEVRDMDLLRGALGEDRLSAWATSYGSYVVATYAQRFPERTDRLVLDSTADPDPSRVARGWLADMAPGAAERFPDFAAWAADPAREEKALRLARRAEEVRPMFLALAERLDREPKRSTTPGTPLTGARLRQALQNALYDDDLFPGLARLLLAAQDPETTPVLPGDLAGPMPDEDATVAVAVICNDVRWPRVAAGPVHARAVAEDRRRYPLTDGMPANVAPCAFWRTAPAEAPARITDEGPSNILMIQNRRDPATPYSAALRMREALGDRARLVTVHRGGHGVYLNNGNACGDGAVTAFLADGRRPAGDVHCEG
jgi:pimeloyl-ACP methyl ester carboxylesterase